MRIGPFEVDMSFKEICSIGEIRSGQACLLKSAMIRNVRGNAADWLKISVKIDGHRLIETRLSNFSLGEENPTQIKCLTDRLQLPPELESGTHSGSLSLIASSTDSFCQPAEIKFEINVLPANFIPVDFLRAKYLAAWIRADDNLRSFVSGHLLTDAESAELSPNEKLIAIYEALSSRELFYQPCPPLIYEDHQQISGMDYILKHGGNCAELSILIASLLYSCGESPVLLLFADHMAVGCLGNNSSIPVTVNNTDEILSLINRNSIYIIEATGVCMNSKKDCRQTEISIKKRLQQRLPCVLVNVVQALRTGGVKPIGEYIDNKTIRCPRCGCDSITISAGDARRACPACGHEILSESKTAETVTVNPSQAMRGRLKYVLRANNAVVTAVQADGTVNYIVPTSWKGKTVSEIGYRAFYRIEAESIELPDSILRIGNGAFFGCKKLRRVILSNSLQEIDTAAFSESGLEYISIPSSVKKIGPMAFRDCTGLVNVDLEEGIREIGAKAFAGCPINSAVIPASVRKISRGAFEPECQLIMLSENTIVE